MPGPYFPDPAAEAIRDPAFSFVASADPNGSVLERLAQILSNFPIQAGGWGNSPPASNKASDGWLAGLTDAIMRGEIDQQGLGVVANVGAADTTAGTVVVTWDSTEKQWYLSNTTGGITRVTQSVSLNAAVALLNTPSGPFGRNNSFDLSGGDHSAYEPPLTLDTMVLEFAAAFRATQAIDNNYGFGLVVGGATGFSTGRHIGVGRRATGWALTSADGTTRSETVEGADTSNNAKHLFRIEWEDKATPEARLYVDGTLKVTKTANLPGIGVTAGPMAAVQWETPSAMITDGLRQYGGWRLYWKATP